MELNHEFTFDALLDRPLMVGKGPYGVRVVIPIAGGRATGERISGEVVGSGADWLIIGSDGFGRLDVRGQIKTDDGALLFITYGGVLEMNDKVNSASQSPTGETSFDDQYYRTTPRLETGDDRYAWVNQTVFVARGRMIPGGVQYEVNRVA